MVYHFDMLTRTVCCAHSVNQGLLLLLLLSLERLLSYYVMWLGLVTEHTF